MAALPVDTCTKCSEVWNVNAKRSTVEVFSDFSLLVERRLSLEHVPRFASRAALRDVMVDTWHSRLEREPEGEDIVCARNGVVWLFLRY